MRLADLLAGLSRLADLGFGLPVGTSLRSCALAGTMARSLDLPEADVRAAFYTALLHHVGCAGYSHETARRFGDELVTNAAAARTNHASAKDMFATFMPPLLAGRPRREQARVVYVALTQGSRWGEEFTTTACEVGRHSSRRLGLPDEVQLSLLHVFDLWRGKSWPQGLNGDAIPIGARIARLTGIAVLFQLMDGDEASTDAVRRRAGGLLDPALTAHFERYGDGWLADLAAADVPSRVLDSEPEPHVTVADVRSVAEVFADLTDLKSPYLLGHSRAVSDLASGAAARLQLENPDDLVLAGLLHDVGRVAISNAVWDKPGPLDTGEWEQVRLHPYHSERILAGSTELARLAPLVGRHHERLDGSGYHRGCTSHDLSPSARVLAAADAYRTLTEERPHRGALPPEQAADRLLDAADGGVLDRDAVTAVLDAAGQRRSRRPHAAPGGLSAREVVVLRLIARGCSNAEIAERLVISRRTAEHHVAHIYTKIGVSCRAAATLFAVEHHLVETNG